MTNIIASIVVVLSTNVIYWDNSSGCPVCKVIRDFPGPGIPALYHPTGPECFIPQRDATERRWVTNVVRTTRAEFRWKDTDYSIALDSTIISSRTNLQRLESTWESK